ncbi:NAD-dependent epimerase/dehydratase family protein [Siculibacillus lacustris]|uniref:NAD-dependent epimerase/dehydratase family protein n=1 Tax=Siculibacillus lacustris TaxID=1549641 RepID=A0A4Q9VH24_9HYPH|nr:NAD(P)H-binding protein [Siculibacillus lacustris]TBW34391.1 NAD-dependent epimerase/dehydratase family protein [Siculibacillus lacustris]
MKIALVGPTGFAGTAILAEALARGHAVTALARDPAKLAPRAGLTVVRADAYDAASVAAAVAGVDAVISAFNPGWSDPEIHDHFLQGARAIDAGTAAAGVKRLLVIGGAGSLYVAPGVQLIDTEHFPKAFFAGADAARKLLAAYLAGEIGAGLDWTFLSPPVMFGPHSADAAAPRTGKYRLGSEAPLMDGPVPAGISAADLAVAILDEIETPKHVRTRFTVASA